MKRIFYQKCYTCDGTGFCLCGDYRFNKCDCYKGWRLKYGWEWLLRSDENRNKHMYGPKHYSKMMLHKH